VTGWPDVHPRVIYNAPDVVLSFRPREEDLAARAERERRFLEQLDRIAPLPARTDHSALAKRQRVLRADRLAQRRRDHPWIGGRMVELKRANEVHRRGRVYSIGKTSLWRAFHAWAVPLIISGLRSSQTVYPLTGRVHLAWRYFPPDLSGIGDHTGVAETVGDLLEDAGAYQDDVLVLHTSGSMIEAPDPDSPRLEIWCRPCTGPATRAPRARDNWADCPVVPSTGRR